MNRYTFKSLSTGDWITVTQDAETLQQALNLAVENGKWWFYDNREELISVRVTPLNETQVAIYRVGPNGRSIQEVTL